MSDVSLRYLKHLVLNILKVVDVLTLVDNLFQSTAEL
jgi:hypothetical protein